MRSDCKACGGAVAYQAECKEEGQPCGITILKKAQPLCRHAELARNVAQVTADDVKRLGDGGGLHSMDIFWATVAVDMELAEVLIGT